MTTPTPEQIEAVRRYWPRWTTPQIVKHIQQREELNRQAAQQRTLRFLAYGAPAA